MNRGMPSIDFCMGLKRPRMQGMPKYACWSFPAIFMENFEWEFLLFKDWSNNFANIIWFFWRYPDDIICSIDDIYYNIFYGSHVPSPWHRFFLETGSSPGWLVNSVGWKMEWIPWRRHLEKWVRWSNLGLFVVPIKSSTNTSTSVTKGLDADGWVMCCCIFDKESAQMDEEAEGFL